LQWRENSIVLSSRRFTEDAWIVTVLNKTLGKTSGLVKRTRTKVQIGDISDVYWRGRTVEQLGTFRIENVFSPFAHTFSNSASIFAIESACSLCAKGLPERAPHSALFESLIALLLSISKGGWLINYAFFELSFLSEVGAGLDLTKCAITGSTENLFYISPRTGCSATREAGDKYKDRLFILPQFLISRDDRPTNRDIFSALSVTGHFLEMYFYGISNGKLPLSRRCLTEELSNELEGATLTQ
jgi:DNA repair protein RecO (recombination protein O)